MQFQGTIFLSHSLPELFHSSKPWNHGIPLEYNLMLLQMILCFAYIAFWHFIAFLLDPTDKNGGVELMTKKQTLIIFTDIFGMPVFLNTAKQLLVNLFLLFGVLSEHFH